MAIGMDEEKEIELYEQELSVTDSPAFSFRLTGGFLNKYKELEPPFGFRDAGANSLGEITFIRTYSRVKSDGTKEKWWEVCERVINGVYSIQKNWAKQNRLPWNDNKAQTSAREAFDRMFNLKWTPPGRGLWVTGTPLVHERGIVAGLYNCSFVSTKDMDHRDPGAVFAWVMDALMLGVGVGFDTRGSEKNIVISEREDSGEVFRVPDTREGWGESIRLLINSYLRTNKTIDFDYTDIRPYGEPIKGFGGTASGPGPLMKVHEQIESVLGARTGEVFDSRAIVDMVNLIGTCVVAGNVRRSATIALGSQDDEGFLELKNYDKYPERAEYGWMSNNTVVVDGKYDYSSAAARIVDNGEPGFLWTDTMQNYGRLKDSPDGKDHRAIGTNPCAEISLESYETCNLVELHLNRHDSVDDLMRTAKFAYLYAKSITLLPTHWPQTNAVIQRNRRIGTSMTGIAGFVDKHGLPEFRNWADKTYDEIQRLDKTYSEWLGIRESIRTTTVKPSGSVSLLSGATPGVHWPSGGKHYLRAIRFSASDPMLSLFRHANYKIEEDQYSANTYVVYFPMETDMERSEKDVSIYEKFDLAAESQRMWSDNSVSVTVTFDPETEKDDIERVLKMHEGELKTVSFLPMSNDTYPQMPYTSISEEEYKAYVGKLAKIDFNAVYDGVENLDAVGSKYCDGSFCEI